MHAWVPVRRRSVARLTVRAANHGSRRALVVPVLVRFRARFGLAAVFYLIAALMLCANLMAVVLPNRVRQEGVAAER